jgi:hypothetical protein
VQAAITSEDNARGTKRETERAFNRLEKPSAKHYLDRKLRNREEGHQANQTSQTKSDTQQKQSHSSSTYNGHQTGQDVLRETDQNSTHHTSIDLFELAMEFDIFVACMQQIGEKTDFTRD